MLNQDCFVPAPAEIYSRFAKVAPVSGTSGFTGQQPMCPPRWWWNRGPSFSFPAMAAFSAATVGRWHRRGRRRRVPAVKGGFRNALVGSSPLRSPVAARSAFRQGGLDTVVAPAGPVWHDAVSEEDEEWAVCHAAFDRSAGDDGFLSREAFSDICRDDLQLGLSQVEIERLFDLMVIEGAKGLTRQRFCRTVRQRFFLSGMRRVKIGSHSDGKLPEWYDLDKDTSENYQCESENFYGRFREIRSRRDHRYHGRFTRERQLWQDEVLQSVVKRTVEQPLPWLVFTCGAMGVGKGFALGWMSSEGIFPLENIVHIDPDHFKLAMPEWQAYVEYGRRLGDPSVPGSRCHRESCYLQEIALEESMRRYQNIWVDGSLRNAEWFGRVFKDVRERYPAYRIAIFQVNAPEAVVRQRVQARANRTGRNIPDNVLQESIDAVERSVMTLSPHADFLANIDNSGAVPKLAYFSSIDRSGDWSLLQARFANTSPAPSDFPNFLAPMFVTAVSGATLRVDGTLGVAEGGVELQEAMLEVDGEAVCVSISPAAVPTLRGESRILANVPKGTALFAWICPLKGDSSSVQAARGARRGRHPLFRNGGLVYFDVEERVLAINAVTTRSPSEHRDQLGMLRFNAPVKISGAEAAAVHHSRWGPVTAIHMREGGAQRYAFLVPGEKLAGRRINVSGGFVYEICQAHSGQKENDFIFFPLKFSLVEE